MNENVVLFQGKPKKEFVYECPCGCQLWHILDDGFIRCYACNSIDNTLCVVAIPEDAESPIV